MLSSSTYWTSGWSRTLHSNTNIRIAQTSRILAGWVMFVSCISRLLLVGEQPVDTTLLTFLNHVHYISFFGHSRCGYAHCSPFRLSSSLMYTRLEVSHSYTPYIYLLTLGRTYSSHFRYLQSHVHSTGGLTPPTLVVPFHIANRIFVHICRNIE